MKDPLEQLADYSLRRPPPDFKRRLHDRLNRTILVQHIVDFFAGAVTFSVVHFFPAVLGWIIFSLTGRFPGRDRR